MELLGTTHMGDFCRMVLSKSHTLRTNLALRAPCKRPFLPPPGPNKVATKLRLKMCPAENEIPACTETSKWRSPEPSQAVKEILADAPTLQEDAEIPLRVILLAMRATSTKEDLVTGETERADHLVTRSRRRSKTRLFRQGSSRRQYGHTTESPTLFNFWTFTPPPYEQRVEAPPRCATFSRSRSPG